MEEEELEYYIDIQRNHGSLIETTQTRNPYSLTSITSHASARPIRWPWASPTYICSGRGARCYGGVSEKVTYAFCDFIGERSWIHSSLFFRAHGLSQSPSHILSHWPRRAGQYAGRFSAIPASTSQQAVRADFGSLPWPRVHCCRSPKMGPPADQQLDRGGRAHALAHAGRLQAALGAASHVHRPRWRSPRRGRSTTRFSGSTKKTAAVRRSSRWRGAQLALTRWPGRPV